MCLGDFNEILVPSEKWGGSARNRSQMNAFQQVLEECELSDLGFSGPKYTWRNCREVIEFIKERIDRGAANQEWIDLFPQAEVYVEFALNSNRSPLLLCINGKSERICRKPKFRYEACWALEEGFNDVIARVWDQQVCDVSKWGRLGEKLKGCSIALTQWQREGRGNTHETVANLQKKLMVIQGKDGQGACDEEKRLHKETQLLLDHDDLRWRQRAKIDWLKYKDRNMKY